MLSVKDKKLISALERDGRSSNASLARSIGTSKEVANYRFKRLIEKGIIKKFELVVDYSKLGRDLYRLVVDLFNLEEGIREEIFTNIRNIENIDTNLFLQSSKDIEIIMSVKSPKDFHTFYYNFISKYGKYLKNKNLSIITKQFYKGLKYLHGDTNLIEVGKEESNENFDEKHIEIIREIRKNPRISFVDLSKKLKCSVSSILQRYNYLKKRKIILGVVPIIDKSKLSYSTYRIEIILNNLKKGKKLIQNILEKENVIRLKELIGQVDFEFEIDFKTGLEVDTFLEKLRVENPEIKDFEVAQIIRE